MTDISSAIKTQTTGTILDFAIKWNSDDMTDISSLIKTQTTGTILYRAKSLRMLL